MTSVDAPPPINADVAQRIYIVKADDFGRGPVLDRWRKFIDVSVEAGVVPSMGVVGADFAHNRPARALARFAHESYDCEFWNHSNAHVDLRSMTSAQRQDDAARCHDILAQAVGAPPVAYGAPFNSMDADCARDVAATAAYRVFFDEAGGASGTWELPRDWYATPEVRTQVFRPVRYSKFVSTLAPRRISGREPPAVIQVHPSYWSDECFDEFEKTLRLLFERGYEPFTVGQFADYLDAGRYPQRERLTLGAAAFAARESGVDLPLMRLAGHLRRFPIRDPREAPDIGIALVEVGEGGGRWALAACAADRSLRATAVTAAASPAVSAAGRSFVTAGAMTFTTTPPDAQAFDVFIAEDPQASWEETLCRAGRILRASGRALVRRRSEVSLFADLVAAAQTRDRERALFILTEFARLNGRRLGVVAPRHAPKYLNDREFSTLAVYAGLQPQLRLPGSRLTPTRFCGASLVVEDLLICTAASKRRARQFQLGSPSMPDDVLALINAGATEILEGLGEGAALLTSAAQLALHVALGEAAPPGAATFASFARAVHVQAWHQALELASSQGLPVSQLGRDILGWLAGESAQTLSEPEGEGLPCLLRIGARLREGGDVFAEIVDTLAPSKNIEGMLQQCQAGPAPDDVYPFAAA